MNMTPVISFNNSINGGSSDSIFLSESGHFSIFSRIRLSYFQNRLLGENPIGIVFANQSRWLSSFIIAPLCYAIEHIVSVRPQEKVTRPYAWRVVTFMANQHPLRDWAIFLRPGQSMNFECCSISGNLPISPSVFSARPFPTIIRLFDSFPEFFHSRFMPASRLGVN